MPKRRERHDDSLDSPNAQRILRAAERLFAKRGYRQVSVREIAVAARVTHPLVYHYYGSKRGLLVAVLQKTQTRLRAAVDPGRDPAALIAGLLAEGLAGGKSYILILARAMADGLRPADWPGGFPTVEAVLDVLLGQQGAAENGPSDAEARELLAVAMAMVVGWVLLEDQLLEVVGLPAERRDEARERVVRSFVETLRPALPTAPG